MQHEGYNNNDSYYLLEGDESIATLGGAILLIVTNQFEYITNMTCNTYGIGENYS